MTSRYQQLHRSEFSRALDFYNAASPIDNMKAESILTNLRKNPNLSLFRRAWVNALLIAVASKDFYEETMRLVAEMKRTALALQMEPSDLIKIQDIEDFAEQTSAGERVRVDSAGSQHSTLEGSGGQTTVKKRVLLPMLPKFNEPGTGGEKARVPLVRRVHFLTLDEEPEPCFIMLAKDAGKSMKADTEPGTEISGGATMSFVPIQKNHADIIKELEETRENSFESVIRTRIRRRRREMSELQEMDSEPGDLLLPQYESLPFIRPLVPHPPAQNRRRGKEIWQRLEVMEYRGRADAAFNKHLIEVEKEIMEKLERIERERKLVSTQSTDSQQVDGSSPQAAAPSTTLSTTLDLELSRTVSQQMSQLLDKIEGNDLITFLQSLTQQVLNRTRTEHPETECAISEYESAMSTMLNAIQKSVSQETNLGTKEDDVTGGEGSTE